MSVKGARPGDPGGPGIEFARADVGYASQPVVRGASLTVARGEFVGLVGPNGAGKSTMLRVLTGEAELLGGDVRVAGGDIGRIDSMTRARIVAVVPQTPPTVFGFTAREYVALGRHPHLGPVERMDATDEAVVDDAMRRTDTARLADERVDTLSGGDLQRLTLAQALAQEPGVLLLDEPTSHLDLNHRLQVLDLVRELADSGLAVLAVFHDLDMAARYSDRIAVVHDGALGPAGSPADVLTPEAVRRVFHVRSVVGADPVTGAVLVTPVLREDAAVSPTRGSVFVLGGNGEGARLMRRLALAGYRVVAGALNRGDIDQAVAAALGVPHVELPPFGQMTESDARAVGELARSADARIVCGVPFGSANLPNLEAVTAAGAPLLFLGELTEERDFTGGQALDLARRASSAGALVGVADEDALAFAAAHAAGSGEPV